MSGIEGTSTAPSSIIVTTKPAAKGNPIDSARAVYVPTDKAKRIWKGSWIYEEAHIQICVRNPKNILAVWHVGPDGRYGKGGREIGP